MPDPMTRDDYVERIVKAAHAPVCCPCDAESGGCDWRDLPQTVVLAAADEALRIAAERAWNERQYALARQATHHPNSHEATRAAGASGASVAIQDAIERLLPPSQIRGSGVSEPTRLALDTEGDQT